MKRFKIIFLLLCLVANFVLSACGDNPTPTPRPTIGLSTGVDISATKAPENSPTAANNATTAATNTTANSNSAPVPTITPVPPVTQPAGSIKLVFWYGLTGSLGNVVQQVVNKYNTSQSKYYIEAVQQPDYDSTINKLNTSLAGGTLPNILQIYDIGTQRMIDSKRIIPVQDYIDRDKLDILSDIEPAVLSYYTIGGKLYSMPFNTSAPVMYFNKTAFKEVGLDPEKKIWTYDELYEAAQKLTKKDNDGKVSRYGVDFTLYSWYFEEQLATQGASLAEPDNGRQQRANKLVFNNEAGVKWLNFLKKMFDTGVGRNSGRDSGTTNGTIRDGNFAAGRSAIIFNSTSQLRNYINLSQRAGAGVEVGVAYIPRPTGAKGGVIVGGASLWLTNQGTKEQQEGAWDFVKFTATPEIQAYFSANTGYYPNRKAAYNIPEMQETLAKYPQFKVAVEQLRATEASVATQGAVFGPFTPTRLAIESAMEQFMTGEIPTAKAALDDAATKANTILNQYNTNVANQK